MRATEPKRSVLGVWRGGNEKRGAARNQQPNTASKLTGASTAPRGVVSGRIIGIVSRISGVSKDNGGADSTRQGSFGGDVVGRRWETWRGAP